MAESSPPLVVTFGETMLRLSPQEVGQRLASCDRLWFAPGGSESNVAVALAQLGRRTRHITRLSDDALGDKVESFLRGLGVDTSFIERSAQRTGVYWTELGAGPRPSRVIYDRQNSAFGAWRPGQVDWAAALEGAAWLHVSGITAALGPDSEALLAQGLNACPPSVGVSMDLNYRAALWRHLQEPRAPEIHAKMTKLAANCQVLLGNESDFADCLGFSPQEQGSDLERYLPVAQSALGKLHKLEWVAVSLRRSHSSRDNSWSGLLYRREKDQVRGWQGPTFRLRDIVDRVGAGDAFAAGILHGLLGFAHEPQKVVDFAVALGALKHTLVGDACLVREPEVWNILNGPESSRIVR